MIQGFTGNDNANDDNDNANDNDSDNDNDNDNYNYTSYFLIFRHPKKLDLVFVPRSRFDPSYHRSTKITSQIIS
jgi:hypothetical protein